MTFTAEEISAALAKCWAEEALTHRLTDEIGPVLSTPAFLASPAMCSLMVHAGKAYSETPFAAAILMFAAGLEVGRRIESARALKAEAPV